MDFLFVAPSIWPARDLLIDVLYVYLVSACVHIYIYI